MLCNLSGLVIALMKNLDEEEVGSFTLVTINELRSVKSLLGTSGEFFRFMTDLPKPGHLYIVQTLLE